MSVRFTGIYVNISIYKHSNSMMLVYGLVKISDFILYLLLGAFSDLYLLVISYCYI